MNWYIKLARSVDQQTVQEIRHLVENGIWRLIVEAKRTLTKQFVNRGLQQLFLQAENAARKIVDMANNGDPNQAAQMCSTLEGLLSKVCGYIDCNEIRQNVENVRIIINDLVYRNQKEGQPQIQQNRRQKMTTNPS